MLAVQLGDRSYFEQLNPHVPGEDSQAGYWPFAKFSQDDHQTTVWIVIPPTGVLWSTPAWPTAFRHYCFQLES